MADISVTLKEVHEVHKCCKLGSQPFYLAWCDAQNIKQAVTLVSACAHAASWSAKGHVTHMTPRVGPIYTPKLAYQSPVHATCTLVHHKMHGALAWRIPNLNNWWNVAWVLWFEDCLLKGSCILFTAAYLAQAHIRVVEAIVGRLLMAACADTAVAVRRSVLGALQHPSALDTYLAQADW